MIEKKLYLEVIDHSVSGESFKLFYNPELEMLETFPLPSFEKLADYYKSEDYISHTNYMRNPIEIIYHFVRRISIKRKLKLIDSFSSNTKRLLDVGCGTGEFLKAAKQKGWNITGIEPSERARQAANKKTDNAIFGVEDFQKLAPKSYDIITLWHVLEHLPNLEEQLSLFKKLLKFNGILIVAVPNFKSYDAKYYQNFWAAYDAPRHLWHFSKQSIFKLAQKNYMKVENILPMVFDAFYVSLLSEKYKSGSFNPLKAFSVGWRSNRMAKKSGEYSSLIYVIKNQE